jgi:hypothetical protein
VCIREFSFVVKRPGHEHLNLSVVLKLKGHKLSGIDQIPAELIKVGVEKFAVRSFNLLIQSGIRRNFLSGRR